VLDRLDVRLDLSEVQGERPGPGEPAIGQQVVSPSLNTSVEVPVKRTVSAPSGISPLGSIAQAGSTGGGP
jgi:hypothetical protein